MWGSSGICTSDTLRSELRQEQAQEGGKVPDLDEMSSYTINLVAEVRSDLDDDEREFLMDHVADVTDELVACESADDRLANADMSVNLNENTVRLSIDVISTSGAQTAIDVGMAAIRSAIHAAGGMTHGWESFRYSVDLPVDTHTNDLLNA